jgi:hypothetical protein
VQCRLSCGVLAKRQGWLAGGGPSPFEPRVGRNAAAGLADVRGQIMLHAHGGEAEAK